MLNEAEVFSPSPMTQFSSVTVAAGLWPSPVMQASIPRQFLPLKRCDAFDKINVFLINSYGPAGIRLKPNFMSFSKLNPCPNCSQKVTALVHLLAF